MDFIEGGLGHFFTFPGLTREGQWADCYYYAHGVATWVIYDLKYGLNTRRGQGETQMKHFGTTGEGEISH